MSLGTGVLPGLGENRVAFVSRDDLAAAAAGILGEGDAGAIYNATGPAQLRGGLSHRHTPGIHRRPC